MKVGQKINMGNSYILLLHKSMKLYHFMRRIVKYPNEVIKFWIFIYLGGFDQKLSHQPFKRTTARQGSSLRSTMVYSLEKTPYEESLRWPKVGGYFKRFPRIVNLL